MEHGVVIRVPEHTLYRYSGTRISDFDDNIFYQVAELLIILSYCDWQLSHSPATPNSAPVEWKFRSTNRHY